MRPKAPPRDLMGGAQEDFKTGTCNMPNVPSHLLACWFRAENHSTKNNQPNETDVQGTGPSCWPRPPTVRLDEYACDAITRAIKHRAEIRDAPGDLTTE
jgi:hypothetical protein